MKYCNCKIFIFTYPAHFNDRGTPDPNEKCINSIHLLLVTSLQDYKSVNTDYLLTLVYSATRWCLAEKKKVLDGAVSGDVLVTKSTFPMKAPRHRAKWQGREWDVCFSQSELGAGFAFLCKATGSLAGNCSAGLKGKSLQLVAVPVSPTALEKRGCHTASQWLFRAGKWLQCFATARWSHTKPEHLC